MLVLQKFCDVCAGVLLCCLRILSSPPKSINKRLGNELNIFKGQLNLMFSSRWSFCLLLWKHFPIQKIVQRAVSEFLLRLFLSVIGQFPLHVVYKSNMSRRLSEQLPGSLETNLFLTFFTKRQLKIVVESWQPLLSQPTFLTFLTYLTYPTYLTYLTYLAYLPYLLNFFKTLGTVVWIGFPPPPPQASVSSSLSS